MHPRSGAPARPVAILRPCWCVGAQKRAQAGRRRRRRFGRVSGLFAAATPPLRADGTDAGQAPAAAWMPQLRGGSQEGTDARRQRGNRWYAKRRRQGCRPEPIPHGRYSGVAAARRRGTAGRSPSLRAEPAGGSVLRDAATRPAAVLRGKQLSGRTHARSGQAARLSFARGTRRRSAFECSSSLERRGAQRAASARSSSKRAKGRGAQKRCGRATASNLRGGGAVWVPLPGIGEGCGAQGGICAQWFGRPIRKRYGWWSGSKAPPA